PVVSPLAVPWRALGALFSETYSAGRGHEAAEFDLEPCLQRRPASVDPVRPPEKKRGHRRDTVNFCVAVSKKKGPGVSADEPLPCEKLWLSHKSDCSAKQVHNVSLCGRRR